MIIKNNKLYDYLKWLGRYGLYSIGGAVAMLIIAINPSATVAVAISDAVINLLGVLLNTFLGISNENFSKIEQADDDHLIELVSEYADEDKG